MLLTLSLNSKSSPNEMIAPGTPETVLPLDLLKSNEVASVVEMSGDAPLVHRLAEMGLRVGAMIRMVKPGAPCLLALDGKRLSLRLNEGLQVLVSVGQPALA
jgi:Fe2+ transport system protein FeoA